MMAARGGCSFPHHPGFGDDNRVTKRRLSFTLALAEEMAMDILKYNRKAWDALVDRQDRWTVPVSSDVTRAAREGRWSIVLTPHKPVPMAWFPPLAGLDALPGGSGGASKGRYSLPPERR